MYLPENCLAGTNEGPDGGAPLASPSSVIVGTAMGGRVGKAAFRDRRTSIRLPPGRGAIGSCG